MRRTVPDGAAAASSGRTRSRQGRGNVTLAQAIDFARSERAGRTIKEIAADSGYSTRAVGNALVRGRAALAMAEAAVSADLQELSAHRERLRDFATTLASRAEIAMRPRDAILIPVPQDDSERVLDRALHAHLPRHAAWDTLAELEHYAQEHAAARSALDARLHNAVAAFEPVPDAHVITDGLLPLLAMIIDDAMVSTGTGAFDDAAAWRLDGRYYRRGGSAVVEFGHEPPPAELTTVRTAIQALVTEIADWSECAALLACWREARALAAELREDLMMIALGVGMGGTCDLCSPPPVTRRRRGRTPSPPTSEGS